MIRSIRNRALRRYWDRQDASGIRPDWLKRVRLVLSALNGAGSPQDLDLPGLRFHALKGDRAGRYAVSVSANWRITFGWNGDDAIDVELEDYHGN